jgi:hypothetical protein
LAHQFPDALSLGEHFLLCAAEFGFGVECAFAPRRLDPLVDPDRGTVAAGLAVSGGLLDQHSGIRVLVEERGGHSCPVGDGPDGEPAALATQLGDGLFDLAELVLGLPAAGSDGCCGLGGLHSPSRASGSEVASSGDLVMSSRDVVASNELA